MSEPNQRFSAALALQVADDLVFALTPSCKQIIIAGSLRRKKPSVGDVEILYVPRFEARPDPADMFASVQVNLVDEDIANLEKTGILERRKNVKGSEIFGPKNKLMRHRQSGIPVDLFSATSETWFNLLVCRTGPADSNTRICMEAQKRGWKWRPYEAGFSRGDEMHAVMSEEEVFEFVGLRCVPPEQR